MARYCAYIEQLQSERSAPTFKQHLACIRMLFDLHVTGQVVPTNPAHRRSASIRQQGHYAGDLLRRKGARDPHARRSLGDSPGLAWEGEDIREVV